MEIARQSLEKEEATRKRESIEIKLSKTKTFLKTGVRTNAYCRDGLKYVHRAAKDGNVKWLSTLLRDGADPISVSASWHDEYPRYQALHFAAEKGHLEVLKMLLENPRKMDLNARTYRRETPLHKACYNCHDSVARLLLTRWEVNVNARDNCGRTALHLSAWNNSVNTVDLLLSHRDINVNIQKSNGNTALISACKHGYAEVALMLLKRRETDVNLRNNCGKTALIVACEERNDKIVQLLLFRPEIDTSVKDNDQRSALDWALQQCQERLANFILKHNEEHGKEQQLSVASADECAMQVVDGEPIGLPNGDKAGR